MILVLVYRWLPITMRTRSRISIRGCSTPPCCFLLVHQAPAMTVKAGLNGELQATNTALSGTIGANSIP